jgi:transglutaminase-like putative cysteine protease
MIIWTNIVSKLISASFILVLFLFATAYAEPGWVKKAIDSTRTVVVDREAPAFIIHIDAETEISKRGKSITHVREVIKILNSLGTRYGIFKRESHTGQEIENLKGWLVKVNGQKLNLKKDDIVKADLELTAGYYNDSRFIVAAFSELEVGDVVAYEYDIIESEYWCSYIQSIVFQRDLPVFSSRYAVKLPKGWALNVAGQYIDSVKYTVNDNRHEWEFGFLPFRPEEAYMPEWSYQMRLLTISCYDPKDRKSYLFGDWKSVSEWVWELFSKATVTDDLLLKALEELKDSSKSKDQLIRAIAEYVRDEVRYVAVEIGEGRYQPRDASLTLLNRYGDCKDKATLMITMLKAADIQASPVLAAVNDTVFGDFPSPFQFNHAIVAIRLDSSVSLPLFPLATVDGWLYYDPTNPANSLGELPIPLHGAQVLRVSESDYDLTTLPPISPDQYLRKYRAEAELGEDNSFSARVKITDYGRRASSARFSMKSESVQDQLENYREGFTGILQNPRISDYKCESSGDSCHISFLLESENYSSSAGDLIMLKIDFLNSEDELDKSRRRRNHPFSFGKPRQDKTEISWRLPAGWKFDGEPEPLNARCKIASLKSNSVVSDSVFYFNSTVEYNGGSIPADEFEDGFSFIKKLKAARNTTAIIKRQ